MSTYRLEVLADLPPTRGVPDDLAAAVAYSVDDRALLITGLSASRVPRTDLVRVTVMFATANDETAIEFKKALPSLIRGYSAEATNLRTGRGKSFRRLT